MACHGPSRRQHHSGSTLWHLTLAPISAAPSESSASTVTPEPLTVALATSHTPSARRWQRVHYARNLLNYMGVTRQGIAGRQPDLIVWPEFAVGFYLEQEPALRAQLGRFARRVNASLLLGAPRMATSETGSQYYNAAYLISGNGNLLDIYDKIRLIPFAEFRPFSLPALVAHRHERPSLFTPGERLTVFDSPKGDFGVMICYEATYPHLARRLVRRGAQFLVNISSDVWFEKSGATAAQQHFSMTVFRAVETKRTLARVSTSGLSGFVDPTGRVYHLSTADTGVTIGEVVPGREMTFYTRYGDWFAWTCTGFALVAMIGPVQRPVRARSRS
ncbi:apolipoprotein N-acyltransferase [Candidatus Entotheonella palauensis]|uniref:apolipoprotein N-acyltransferase n=1 Tax=Candidatus Entotheonella palauensis TaxID=93172 RepID=UPI0021182A83|nr:apolipoprotein N-acyltransferase [Candidatus Entotheonella palauensis]